MITKRQRATLGIIKSTHEKHGYGPSYEEIAAALGIVSKGAVHRILHGLAKRGYVKITPSSARSMEILRLPADMVDNDGLVKRMAETIEKLKQIAIRERDLIIEGNSKLNPDLTPKPGTLCAEAEAEVAEIENEIRRANSVLMEARAA